MGANVIAGNAYTYSANNNDMTKADLNGTTTYQYDATSQLTQAMHPAFTEAFTYDDSSNRITETRDGAVVNYTHTAGNRIETRNGVVYTHDGNGNIISKAGITGTTTYEYDYANRLKRVTMPNGTIAEYTYDALWRRIEKKITPSPLAGEGGGEGIKTTRYLYDGLNTLAEYDGNNALKTKYTHNRAIDDPLAMERSGQTDPRGLGPEWKLDPKHVDPNDPGKQLFRDPTGRPIEWNPAQPGKSSKEWAGRDHWHDPWNSKRYHFRPGSEIPDPAPLPKPSIPWWQRIPVRWPGPFRLILDPKIYCEYDPSLPWCNNHCPDN